MQLYKYKIHYFYIFKDLKTFFFIVEDEENEIDYTK